MPFCGSCLTPGVNRGKRQLFVTWGRHRRESREEKHGRRGHRVKKGSRGPLPQNSGSPGPRSAPCSPLGAPPCVLGCPPLHSWAYRVPPGAELCSGWVTCGAAPGLPGTQVLPSTEPCLGVSPPLATLRCLLLHSHSSFLASTYCAEGRG